MTIGERIKQRRLELGLSQEELAKRMGNKSRASVSTVENGKEDLTTDRIRKYANALDCRPAYLMGWTDNPVDGPVAKVLAARREPTDDIERMRFNETITDDERNIIVAYRKADTHTRRMVEYALRIKEMSDANR